ncbi:hypothetical protein [Paraburkholderia humisilvae]|nr:hypothetical protein [Paraburkholderia humisilvae]
MPDKLPKTQAALSSAASKLSAFACVRSSLSSKNSREEVRALLGDRGEIVSHPIVHVGSDRVTLEGIECDAYFAVDRVSADPGVGFLSSLLLSYCEMFDDFEKNCTSLAISDLRYLYGLIPRIFSFSGIDDEFYTPITLPRSQITADQVIPNVRWEIGHHAFFTTIQALSFSLSCLLHAIEEDRLSDINSALELATSLVLGSSAVMKYASAFSASEYSEIVRPTMPDGFSGIYNFDHRYLVGLFGRLRGVVPILVVRSSDMYSQFLTAVGAMYEAHAGVCSRFGGGTLPSLRMKAQGTSTVQTSVELLDKFRIKRLALLK